MAKLIKGIDPIDTVHELHHHADGLPRTTQYRVIAVIGQETYFPSPTVMVAVKLNQRVGYSADTFITLPLVVFAREFVPIDKESQFWEDEDRFIPDANSVFLQ